MIKIEVCYTHTDGTIIRVESDSQHDISYAVRTIVEEVEKLRRASNREVDNQQLTGSSASL